MGEKDLVVNINQDDAGVALLSLAVRRTDQPTPEDPLDFTLVIKAPGYLDAIQSFSLASAEGHQIQTMRLVRPSAPAEGITVRRKPFMTSSIGTAEEVSFGTDPNSMQENVEITIPANTRMYDANGNKLSGQIRSTVVHFDIHDKNASASIPGGMIANNALDVNGQSLGKMAFFAGCCFIHRYELDL